MTFLTQVVLTSASTFIYCCCRCSQISQLYDCHNIPIILCRSQELISKATGGHLLRAIISDGQWMVTQQQPIMSSWSPHEELTGALNENIARSELKSQKEAGLVCLMSLLQRRFSVLLVYTSGPELCEQKNVNAAEPVAGGNIYMLAAASRVSF